MLSGSEITRIGIIGFPGRAYAGFAAKAASDSVPTRQGLEYTLSDSKLHYTLSDSLMHYTMRGEN